MPILLFSAMLALAAALQLAPQFPEFDVPLSHPAIAYDAPSPTDPIAKLNRDIFNGEVPFTYDRQRGWLPALLLALDIPVESQTLVFTKTSLQAEFIGPTNPRAIYFNDSVAVGWIRGARLLEVAAHDPRQGVRFYAIPQTPVSLPQFRRSDQTCLTCHRSSPTLGVPGLAISSVFPDEDGVAMSAPAHETSDHRTPMAERFGGWFVTGRSGPNAHLGKPLPPDLDLTGYASFHSDLAALMVLAHQTQMVNLITRFGWEARVAASSGDDALIRSVLDKSARELVDYLLFVDEAPLAGALAGSSRFAETFAARGPRDSKGRSLRDLDLERRLLRYPCSYMIYTAAFEALPPETRHAIYRRMWTILSGADTSPRYQRLTRADRRAIVEILRDTKPEFRPFAG